MTKELDESKLGPGWKKIDDGYGDDKSKTYIHKETGHQVKIGATHKLHRNNQPGYDNYQELHYKKANDEWKKYGDVRGRVSRYDAHRALDMNESSESLDETEKATLNSKIQKHNNLFQTLKDKGVRGNEYAKIIDTHPDVIQKAPDGYTLNSKNQWIKIKYKNESAVNLIEAIVEGDTLTSAQLFNEVLRARIDEKVAAKKKEVASKISGDNSKAFDKIVKSKHKYVLTAAAKHPNIPHHHLNALGNHDDPHVQHAALQNPKFGADPSKEEKDEKAHDKFQKELITHIKSFKGKV